MEKGISIIIPAYLEAENLSIILPEIKKAVETLSCPYEILIVDTVCPMDNTKEVTIQNSATYINRSPKNYYGDAIRTGIKIAKYSYIVIMDADGSHNPNDIISLYNKIQEGFDICIGSRYINGGSSDNGFILKLMSFCLNLTFVLLFKLNIKDISNSFRIYNADKLKTINIECQNFDLVEEVLIKLKYKYNDLKVAEIPIYFNKRLKGESKRSLIIFIISYFKTLFKLLKLKRNKQIK